ncbi:MAG: glycerol-3-phosphate dehydrogenase/oxidase [Myxococcales bacterium]|nr:glycerol-3-phosphate dehydrogenase/oxidase [Myxococcales bacterium]
MPRAGCPTPAEPGDQVNRDSMLSRLAGEPFDVIVIGGGATGLGIAVDATTRGYRTLLLEAHDFAKGTSSRSTKLVHGGVRYLEQLDFGLVGEALRERGLLYENAPHLVHNQGFVVPRFRWWEGPFYGAGLKLYDALAGRQNLAPSRSLSREATLEAIPNVEQEDLLGGTLYHDAQFDDARMAISLALTAAQHRAVLINRAEVVELLRSEDTQGATCGVGVVDRESGRRYRVLARAVINATGVFSNAILKLDRPDAKALVSPSQGIHLVLDASFQPSANAIMVPHTDDGRMLFVIPWLGRVLVGTTDTPVTDACLEPRALPEEIEFVLRNANRYLTHDPRREDVLSVFAGLRPLVRDDAAETKSISREHLVQVSASGLVSIVGGKWTTYRKMAEDAVDQAAEVAGLPRRRCNTETLQLQGWKTRDSLPADEIDRSYGTDLDGVEALGEERPEWKQPLHPRLPYRGVHVVWALRHEMARDVEDVLARRTRCLLLDARAAVEAAPAVAEMAARELGHGADWAEAQVREFEQLARGYLLDA